MEILRHNNVEIWRVYASWESYERFETAFNMLRQRYGKRFAGLPLQGVGAVPICIGPLHAKRATCSWSLLQARAMLQVWRFTRPGR